MPSAPEKWIAAIQKGPSSPSAKRISRGFPMLQALLSFKRESQNPPAIDVEKLFTASAGAVAGLGVAQLLKPGWEKLAERFPTLADHQAKLTRRQFMTRAALFASLVLAGRTADHATTYIGLEEAYEGLEEFKRLPEFVELPPEVKERLMPPADFLEDSPIYRPLVKSYIAHPANFARDALISTIAGSSLAAGGAKIVKSPALYPLGTSMIAFSSFLIAAKNHAATKERRLFFCNARGLRRELRALHVEMSKK